MVSSSSSTTASRRAGEKKSNMLKRSQSKMMIKEEPAHITVQRLNARGAFYIERGEYTKAIDRFVQALKLWETVEEESQSQQDNHDVDDDIDDCIMQSSFRKTTNSVSTRNNSNSNGIPPPPPPPTSTATSSPPPPFYARRRRSSSTGNPHQKSRRRTTMAKQPSLLHDLLPKEQQMKNESSESESDRFIYQQPILTTPQFWRSDYTPNNTLSLILILNLAMAHHLSGLQQQEGNKRLFQKALQLYELAHQLQIENEGLCSPIATMIIANNVGEIHLCVNNPIKHELCLQHLLSTMMYMIDNNLQQQQSGGSGSVEQQQQENTTTNMIFNNTSEWDGFLKNVTSTLILQQNCAGAA